MMVGHAPGGERNRLTTEMIPDEIPVATSRHGLEWLTSLQVTTCL
jgi:hypothetical protein